MRIIAGAYRGRKLNTPRGTATRPTSDRTRESLFAILESSWLRDGFHGRLVLDLFAGSGALGFEALSRGAASVTAFESSSAAVAAIRANVAALDISPAVYTLVATPLPRGIESAAGAVHLSYKPDDKAAVIFADPPWTRAFPRETFSRLAALLSSDNNPLLVYEWSEAMEEAPPGWTQLEHRSLGASQIHFCELAP